MSDLKGFVIKQHMTELSSMKVPALGHPVICFDVKGMVTGLQKKRLKLSGQGHPCF